MFRYVKFALSLCLLSSAAVAQEDDSQCADIPNESIITSFGLLPVAIQLGLSNLKDFSQTDVICNGEKSFFHSHQCFERAAFLHDEWIVIIHHGGQPEGHGQALVWKSLEGDLREISWEYSYASLCTFRKLGDLSWRGYILSKEEGKPPVFAPPIP